MPEDDTRVDPRYDPAFQRGFDGPVASGIRPRSVQRPALVTPAPYREAHPEPEAAATASPAASTPDSAATAPDRADEDDDLAAPTHRRLSRNPFLVALTILGAGMVLGGIAWASQARAIVATRGGASTDLDYWFLQASVVAAPLTVLTGVGILAGVLFVAAAAWNKRP